jgi:hypothetical protein
MSKLSRTPSLLVGTLLAGLAWTAPALAEIKWTMSGSSDCGTNCISLAGNTRSFTQGGVTLTTQAWSNTGGTAGLTTGTLETAYLGLYGGGLGVKNRDGGTTAPNTGDADEWVPPEHGIDNQGNRWDGVLASFSSAIDLNKVEIGWMSGDSDITVLAYTGAGVPTLLGLTYSQLTSNGWTFVGHYDNLAVGTAKSVNPTNIASAYWLITAYLPLWRATGWSANDDHLKLLALYGEKTTRVPEPHALLLIGVAALGLWATRKGTARPA